MEAGKRVTGAGRDVAAGVRMEAGSTLHFTNIYQAPSSMGLRRWEMTRNMTLDLKEHPV